MAKNTKTSHEIIYVKKDINSRSKQDDIWWNVGTIAPPDDPKLLIKAYQYNFVIGGIVDRIVTTASSAWTFDESVSAKTRSAIESIDLEEMFLSYFVTGNFFLEKIRNGFGQVVAFERFMSDKIRIAWENGEKEYHHLTGAKPKVFPKKDVVHLRSASITSRFYGESRIAKCADQIALLTFIDSYYSGIFESGFFSNRILTDKESKLDAKQKEALKNFLEDRAKGLKNAFSLLVLPADFGTISLDDINNTEKFLQYREELIHSIAIAMNVPIDILLPQKAGRATKEISLSELNTDIIWPMQQRIIRELKKELREDFADIDGVSILAIDTKNQMDEMKVATGYVASGIMTANEARESLGLEKIEGGDELKSIKRDEATAEEMKHIEESIEKMYNHLLE